MYLTWAVKEDIDRPLWPQAQQLPLSSPRLTTWQRFSFVACFLGSPKVQLEGSHSWSSHDAPTGLPFEKCLDSSLNPKKGTNTGWSADKTRQGRHTKYKE